MCFQIKPSYSTTKTGIKSKQLYLYSYCFQILILAYRQSHVTIFLIQAIYFITSLVGSNPGLGISIPVSHRHTNHVKKKRQISQYF